MQPLNDLIPPATTIVVLDTSPARNLGYTNTPPPWVTRFAKMASNGYSFSLADNAFAELHSQIASGAITDEQAATMLGHLKIFLNPSLRVLPGKMDITGLIGANARESGWSIEEVRALSAQCWDTLTRASKAAVAKPPSADDELQSEREDWFAIFKKLGEFDETSEPLNEYEHKVLTNALRYLDKSAPKLSPPLSVRRDLQARLLWRQYVRSKKTSEPYDPMSLKKKNDGIDFDLYNYLLLPALIVTTDSGFFEKIADIKSYQKAWFWKPEALAQAWIDGKRPCATWP